MTDKRGSLSASTFLLCHLFTHTALLSSILLSEKLWEIPVHILAGIKFVAHSLSKIFSKRHFIKKLPVVKSQPSEASSG